MLKLYQTFGDDLQEGTVVYADEQTKGRGQVGNSWESEPGKNLTATVILYPDFLSAERQFLITQVGALAVCDFLTQMVGLSDIRVKWPNDVYWKDRKISGTLNEAMLIGKEMTYVMLGVGINLNQIQFRSPAPNPVSVVQITEEEFPVDKAVLLFRQCLMQRYMQLVNGGEADLVSDYSKVLYRNDGNYYPYLDEDGCRFDAKIVCVHPNGEYELEMKDGARRVFLFKQVSFLL